MSLLDPRSDPHHTDTDRNIQPRETTGGSNLYTNNTYSSETSMPLPDKAEHDHILPPDPLQKTQLLAKRAVSTLAEIPLMHTTRSLI